MAYGRSDGSAWAGGGAQGAFMATAAPASLTARLVAYMIDLVVIFALAMLIGFLIGILGLFTFGLTWPLYAVLFPMTALLYSAITIGGRGQGTIGMRLMGIRVVDAATGGRIGGGLAALHALLFYGAASTGLLLFIDIAMGVVRSDNRLGHDLLAGILLVRR